jgi:hypothetical protein
VRSLIAAATATVIAAGLTACGFNVQSPDLFLLTRTGQGSKLTLLVNYGGTLRCNGGKPRQMSDAMLISARDLSDNLADDGTAKLSIPATPSTVFYYRVKLQQGTIAFPDSSARTRSELAQAELFTAQAAQQVCHLSG